MDNKQGYWKKRGIEKTESATYQAKITLDDVYNNLQHAQLLTNDIKDAISSVHGAFTNLLVMLHAIEVEKYDRENNTDNKIVSTVIPS